MEQPIATGCPNCERMTRRLAELESKVAELEERMGKDSTNSSKPPSSDLPWITNSPEKDKSGRKPGGQPGHKGFSREQAANPDFVVRHYAPRCGLCSAALVATADAGTGRRHQVAELAGRPVTVTEHQSCGLRCGCGHVSYGEIPKAVLARSFGPKLSAAVSVLAGQGHVSRRTAQSLLETVFNIDISLGAVAGLEREASEALAAPHAEALAAVRLADVKNADETGWFNRSKLCWLWLAVSQSALAAAFVISDSRGKKGARELLGEKPSGVVGSDRWSAYNGLLRQLCWAHLLRDFQKLQDFNPKHTPGRLLGLTGKRVAEFLFKEWRKYGAGEQTRAQMAERLGPARAFMRRALDRALDCGDRKTARFAKKLLKTEAEMWTFLTVENVEPTNNLAERHLRPGVLWRKTSLGSWGETGCRFAERMMTVVQTLKMRGRNIMAFVGDAVKALRDGIAAPSLFASP